MEVNYIIQPASQLVNPITELLFPLRITDYSSDQNQMYSMMFKKLAQVLQFFDKLAGQLAHVCLVFAEQWVWSEGSVPMDTNSCFPVSINRHCQQLECLCHLEKSDRENIFLNCRHPEVILLPCFPRLIFLLLCHVVCSAEEDQVQVSDCSLLFVSNKTKQTKQQQQQNNKQVFF